MRVSRLHRTLAVDSRTGAPLCPPYPTGDVQLQVHEFWPSDMFALFRKAGMPRRAAPPLPDCLAGDADQAPRIASPLHNVVYTLRRKDVQDGIGLEAAVSSEVRTLYWFDGSALIDRVPADRQPLRWFPTSEGIHLLRAIDDQGRLAQRDVQIRFLH